MHRSIFVFFIFLISRSAFAIPEDSVQQKIRIPTSVRFLKETSFANGLADFQHPDTNLFNQQETNPALTQHWNYLGSLGSPAHPQIFNPVRSLMSHPGIRCYDLYLMDSDSLHYFRTNKRFSQINYHQGAFKEQQIRVLHTQNITPYWNAGLDFNRLAVRDFMRNSQIYQNQFSLFTWYESKNMRYHLFAHTDWNKIRNNLNGGLANDSLFEHSSVSNLGIKGLSIQLSDARHSMRRHVSYASQYYDVGTPDHPAEDSIHERKINSTFRLHHSIRFESGSLAYTDQVADSSYYSNFYYSPTASNDSMHYDDLRNRVEILLPVKDSASSWLRRSAALLAGIEHQWFRYRQLTDTSWNNLTLLFSIQSIADTDHIRLTIQGRYLLSGTDQGSYAAEMNLRSPEFRIGQLVAAASVQSVLPDIIYRFNASNHFQWKNNFDHVRTQTLSAGYFLKSYHFSLAFKYHHLENWVIVNEQAYPEQWSKAGSVFQAELQKRFNYRNLHFDNSLFFQESSDQRSIPLPQWVSTHTLYLEKAHFNRALLAQYGIKLRYSSGYHAEAFMPSSGLFYLQNSKTTGNYPLFDLYIIGKIKTATLFLDFENVADGLIRDSYSYVPSYPQPGRVVKFGLVWRFFD